jgi:hypothetical protein
MLTCREITAALSLPVGAGPQRLHRIAVETLERAAVGPHPDPRAIIIGLGRSVRIVTRALVRAELTAECARLLWDADGREFGLSGFFGASLIALHDHGLRPSPSDVTGLAGYLALPEQGVPPSVEVARQTFAPAWFLEAHQRRRRWSLSDSGLYPAIGR